MSPQSLDDEDPDRLYTITGGRSRAEENRLDLVTLIVGECDPTPGMQSEHAKILRLSRHPIAVVELSSELRLPVSIVKILLCDLLDTGRVTARHPSSGSTSSRSADSALLKQVLVGLEKL
jgi:uncharacterized protein DUF742